MIVGELVKTLEEGGDRFTGFKGGNGGITGRLGVSGEG